MLSTIREKVTWCEPEQSSDKYNLEVKLTTLLEVEADLKDCEKIKNDTDLDLKLLEQVENLETIKKLQDDRDKENVEMEALKITFVNIKGLLENNINMWERYEAMSENVMSLLKKDESRVRNETSILLNPEEIEAKYADMVEFQKLFNDDKTEMNKLVTFTWQLIEVISIFILSFKILNT